MRCFVSLVMLCGLLMTSGCADAEPEAMAVAAPVNTLCPIMGHEVTDDGGRADFDGQTVGFCCPGCIDKWEALSDEEKTASLKSPPAHDHGESADETHEDGESEDHAEGGGDESDEAEE